MPVVDPEGDPPGVGLRGICGPLRDGWEGNFSYPFREQYSLSYHVLVDEEDDGPVTIYTFAESHFNSNPPGALPILNQVYTTDREVYPPTVGESSDSVICHDVQIRPYNIRTSQEEEFGYWPWLYTARFDPPDGRVGWPIIKNPLQRPVVEWLEFEERERILRYDNEGNMIKNTAGEPFIDPPITRDYVVPIHVFSKNYASIDEVADLAVKYVSAVNITPFRRYKKFQCLMLAPRVSQPRIENRVLFHRVEWRVALQTIKTKTRQEPVWQPIDIVNAGYHWVTPGANGAGREVKPIWIEQFDKDNKTTGHYTKPSTPMRLTPTGPDGQGNSTPADFRPYVGFDGTLEDDFLLTFDIYKEEDFNALLPTRLNLLDFLGNMTG